jgi:RHS repeat-associated protein
MTDHAGTPYKLIDSEGKTIWEADADDWGAVRNEKGIRQPIRFQGQYHDEETGLYYNRHRFYDPLQGRYVTQDPIGLRGGLNLHAYAPNPVGWIDPLGLAYRGCGVKPGDPLGTVNCFPVAEPGEYIPEPTREGTAKAMCEYFPNSPGCHSPLSESPPLKLRSDGRPQGAGCGDAKTDALVPDSYMGIVSFGEACKAHDDCYGTPGSDKSQCDAEFGENLKLACKGTFPDKKTGDYEWDKAVSRERINCNAQADWYQFAVEQWGGEAFDNAQKEAAERAAREQKK